MNDTGFVPGSIVSLADNGILTRKAGSTVYKNEHIFEGKNMLNLQSVLLDNGIIAGVYHAGLLVVKLSEDDSIQVEKRVLSLSAFHL